MSNTVAWLGWLFTMVGGAIAMWQIIRERIRKAARMPSPPLAHQSHQHGLSRERSARPSIRSSRRSNSSLGAADGLDDKTTRNEPVFTLPTETDQTRDRVHSAERAEQKSSVSPHAHFLEAPFGRLRKTRRLRPKHFQPSRLHLNCALFWSRKWGPPHCPSLRHAGAAWDNSCAAGEK